LEALSLQAVKAIRAHDGATGYGGDTGGPETTLLACFPVGADLPAGRVPSFILYWSFWRVGGDKRENSFSVDGASAKPIQIGRIDVGVSLGRTLAHTSQDDIPVFWRISTLPQKADIDRLRVHA
jgi:hypothetical protein